MRKCTECGDAKPPDDFYASNKSRCKGCVKARVRQYRADNIDRVRAYDRERGDRPHRRAAVKARAHRYVGKYKTFRESHPDKRACHLLVQYALRRGDLVPQPCERCGHAINVHAHHEDYSKPLDVIWLCPPCHGARHREINEQRRSAAA